MSQPYIALRPIFVGNALGYAPGDVVSDEVAKDQELGGEDIARRGTKAAEAVSPSQGDPGLQQDSTTPPKK